MPKTVRES